MKIIVVGDGGVGSNLLPYLVKTIKLDPSLPQEILIIDGDKVEPKNIARQDFTGTDVNAKKADASAEYLIGLASYVNDNPIKISSLPVYLHEDTLDVIKDGDIVFVGVDNYITRRIIDDYVKNFQDILVIYGGNEYTDGDVNVYYRKNGVEVTPRYSIRHPEILTKDEFPDEKGCEEAVISSPQLLVTNLTVALYMLEVFYQVCVFKRTPYIEKLFDIKTGEVRCVK